MATSFVPAWHFTNPSNKLKPEWAYEAVTWCWHNTHNHNLLEDKNIEEINGYASGDFDMTPYRRMFKSEAKKMDAQKLNGNSYDTRKNVTHEVGYVPLPLIPTKLDSAIAVVQKIPVEVKVTAIDPLAAKKKNEDLTFLKNKPKLEADLQDLADQLQIGKVDLGTTKHSAIPFSDNPYGLDLNEPDELEVFVDLLYNLGVEAAFETALEEFQEIKNGVQVKLLEIRDQFRYGVSCHHVFESAVTRLPDIKYEYPGSISTPYSELPDKSDNTHRFKAERMSVLDMFNAFGDEICSKEDLDKIINAPEFGYCACNKLNTQKFDNFNQFNVDLVYCEIKSVDYVGIAPLNKKSKFSYVVTDEKEAEKCTNKIWGQNTYCFWWLKNTKHFFGIHKLPYSNRTVGRESYQNFSTNIYKSKEKSAVELSIGENKKAQYADIKIQYAIITSLPSGKYIDLKYLRSALGGLTDEADKWTQQDLINLIMERNIMIGDTQDFDGKNEGQFKPFQEIVGGLKIAEIAGLLQVIIDAKNNISQFTGINEQLTGQSANPEGLVGMQKLLINSSINALYYVNEAIGSQERKKFAIWATIIKAAIERGGKSKQAIIDMIGAKKVSLIDYLDDVPLHTMGVKVTVAQREDEEDKYQKELFRLKELTVINTVDDYMLSGITNKKDKMGLIAVKYKQWEKKQEKIRAEQMANQQALVQQQGQNQLAATEAKVQGDVTKIFKQGEVSATILKLASELGIQASQLDGIIKKALQQDRGNSQLDKSIQTLRTKNDLENQKPFE